MAYDPIDVVSPEEHKWFEENQEKILNAILLIAGGAIIATINFCGVFSNEILNKPQILKYILMCGWFFGILSIVANIFHRFEKNHGSWLMTTIDRVKRRLNTRENEEFVAEFEKKFGVSKLNQFVVSFSLRLMFFSFFLSLFIYVLSASLILF